MGWRAEWLKRASPEAIEEYRIKERARVRKWERDNSEKVKARKISPAKAEKRAVQRVLREQARVIARAARAEKQKVYAKSWHAANRAAANEKRLQHYRENREAHLARCKEWAEANRERSAAYKARWYEANKAKLQKQARARLQVVNARSRERRATDIQFALASRLRTRMQKAVRACGAQRSLKIAELIGCPVKQFRQHIERQFTNGMAWENRSKWHLDHIRPIASFDLTDPTEQLACFHFTNIRPIWRSENARKGDRLTLLL